MRTGWSIKEAGHVLGVNPKKVSQALTPALHKIARLMLADPVATVAELHAAMASIAAEQQAHPHSG